MGRFPTTVTATTEPAAGLFSNEISLKGGHPERRKQLVDFLIGVSAVGDALMVFAGLLLGFWIRFASGWFPAQPRYDLKDYSGLICVGVAFCMMAFVYLRLYDSRHILKFRQAAVIILKGCSVWLIAYLGLSLAFKLTPSISRLYVTFSWFSCVVLLLAWRWLFCKMVHLESLAKYLRNRILLVGWNSQAEKLASMVTADPTHPYEVVGCIPAPNGRFDEMPPRDVPVMGDYHNLTRILEQRLTDIVVLTDVNSEVDEIVALSNQCEKEFVQFKVIPSYFQILASGLHLENLSGVPILGVTELPLDRVLNRVMKRCVDVLGALFGLMLSAPIIAVCGLMVYIESPGSIFYRQIRMGRNGRLFAIYKLRSMRLDAEKHGAQWAKQNDPRRLKIGAFLRAWNLDEVPQFWNVLKGEMSLVGPRPERPELIANFKHEIPHYNARHGSKPGITGWAQIHGLRGDTSLVERVKYDLYYLENWSLLLDVQIMVLTFFRRENAY